METLNLETEKSYHYRVVPNILLKLVCFLSQDCYAKSESLRKSKGCPMRQEMAFTKTGEQGSSIEKQ